MSPGATGGPSFEIIHSTDLAAGEPAAAVPGFTVVGRGHSNLVRTPVGTYEGAWWEPLDLSPNRDTAPALDPVVGQLITQASQTCWATACLNAWITRGAVTGREAQRIQDTLLQDPVYTPYFRPGTKHWFVESPPVIAWAAREETGKAPLRFALDETAGPETVDRHLRAGRIAVVGTNLHFRTVLRPSDRPDHLAIIDPLQPNKPSYIFGRRIMPVLDAVQTIGRAVLF